MNGIKFRPLCIHINHLNFLFGGFMSKKIQLNILLILLSLLILDFIVIKLTTIPQDTLIMQHRLEQILNTPIHLLELKAYGNRQYLTYLNPQSSHIDLAIYHKNKLLPTRYNLEEIRAASSQALISPCQFYQTDTTLVIWGENSNLSAKSMIIKIGHEVFIEDLTQSKNFLYIYAISIHTPCSLKFLGPNGEDLTSSFLSVKIP